MYMNKKPRGPALSQQQLDEVYFLSNTGCPCCGHPLKNADIARAYKISRSTTSRIKNGLYHTYPLELDLRGQVKLVKEVRALSEQAKELGLTYGS